MRALQMGHYRVIGMLLQEGIDPNYRVDKATEKTPLMIMCACTYNSFDVCCKVIKVLIDCKETQVNRISNDFDHNGWTALMYAADKGFYEAIEILLSHPDIDVNLLNGHGENALNRATNQLSEKCKKFYKILRKIPNKKDYCQESGRSEKQFDEWIKEKSDMIWRYNRCIELLKERM